MHEMLQNIQDCKRAAVLFLIKTQQKRSSHAFDYEVIASKCKLKDLIQFTKEKNQMTNFSQDSSFYQTHNSCTVKRTNLATQFITQI